MKLLEGATMSKERFLQVEEVKPKWLLLRAVLLYASGVLLTIIGYLLLGLGKLIVGLVQLLEGEHPSASRLAQLGSLVFKTLFYFTLYLLFCKLTGYKANYIILIAIFSGVLFWRIVDYLCQLRRQRGL